jgi:hypothetical protein
MKKQNTCLQQTVYVARPVHNIHDLITIHVSKSGPLPQNHPPEQKLAGTD